MDLWGSWSMLETLMSANLWPISHIRTLNPSFLKNFFFYKVCPINHVLHLLNNPNQRRDSAISPTQSCGLSPPWIYLHPIDEALALLALGTTSISGLSLSNWPSLEWLRVGWHHWGQIPQAMNVQAKPIAPIVTNLPGAAIRRGPMLITILLTGCFINQSSH